MTDFLKEVQKGMKGLNQGLPNCFDRFNDYLCGTQKGTYYAIGGLPGTGKTALADSNFVLAPFIALKKRNLPINVDWHYYSFEISKKAKRAKWTAYMLYYAYGIVTDSNEILSRGKNRASQELYEKIVEVNGFMDELFSYIHFVDEPQTAGQIYFELLAHAEKNGKFQYETYEDGQGVKQTRKCGYVNNRVDNYNIVIVDHVGLIKKQKGMPSKKENIDLLSSEMIYFRNLCDYTPVMISQFNRSLTAIERQKFKASDLAPTLEDFKDTGVIPEDANVALGTFNPGALDFKNYGGYDLKSLGDNFRAVNLMKNRDGGSDKAIGMQFIGEIGGYSELPPASMFDLGSEDYKNYVVSRKTTK